MFLVFAKVKGLLQMPELHDASSTAIMRRLKSMDCCSMSFINMFCTAVHRHRTMWAAKITINCVFPLGGGHFVSKLRTVEQCNF